MKKALQGFAVFFAYLSSLNASAAIYVWNDYLKLPDGISGGWLVASGSMFTNANASGYLLYGQMENFEADAISAVGAAYANDGSELWSILVTEAQNAWNTIDPYYTNIHIRRTNQSNEAWVVAETSEGFLKYGIVDAVGLTQNFAFQFDATTKDDYGRNIGDLSDDRIYITHTEAGQVDLQVIGADGSLVIDKSYSSPEYIGANRSSGGTYVFLSERNTQNGFILSIVTTSWALFETGYDMTIDTLHLDETGQIEAQSRVVPNQKISRDEAPDIPMILDDDSVVYVFYVDEGEGGQIMPKSLITRVTPEGTVPYAKEIPSVALLPNTIEVPSSGNSVLTGTSYSREEGSEESDVVLVNLNLKNGAVSNGIQLDIHEIDNPIPLPIQANGDFIQPISAAWINSPEDFGFDNYILKTSMDLSSTKLVKDETVSGFSFPILSYNEANDSLLLAYNVFGLQVHSLSTNLETVFDCIDISEADSPITELELSSTDFTYTVETPDVETGELNTSLISGAFQLEHVEIPRFKECEAPGGPVDPPPPAEPYELDPFETRIEQRGEQYYLSWVSEAETSYEILRTTEDPLHDSFDSIATRDGSGERIEILLDSFEDVGSTFYKVREIAGE